jgi:hypothetical protein
VDLTRISFKNLEKFRVNKQKISVSDPDWIRNQYGFNQAIESESGSRRAKMTHKNRKKIKKFHVLKCWMFSFKG